MFYIMKARHLTSTNRKLGLTKITCDEPNCTILVADREVGFSQRTVRAFIIGAAADYNVMSGDVSQYKIDTGMGYKGEGRLNIVDVLQVRDGFIVQGDLHHEPAYTWVMK